MTLVFVLSLAFVGAQVFAGLAFARVVSGRWFPHA